ncbi:MAG TPA: deoxyribodipyrimidine photo-lyase, partial [Dongiaceae bacterium]|nr:deoxyribodipyrimidine photo-lyase [Dongiaceae bacterium]
MAGSGGTIVWFRLDLRVDDNPALAWAAARGGPIVPVYIWAPEEEGDWPPGAASRWWLDRSLAALATSLAARGSRLVLRRGPSGAALLDLARATGADAVAWNRRSEPALVARDRKVGAALAAAGLATADFNAHLLFDPREVRTRGGGPFKVFTPFWLACLERDDPGGRVAVPVRLPAPTVRPASEERASFALAPRLAWDAGLAASWTPGEAGARAALDRFAGAALDAYPVGRDRPAVTGTSRLSPHLHFGEIGPRAVWGALPAVAPPARARRPRTGAIPGDPVAAWRRELGWRDFAHHLLEHFPHTPER